MFRRPRKIKKKGAEITPDEIFLDAENMPGFREEFFEGRLEKPIPGSAFIALGVFSLFLGLFLLSRVFDLQILRGGIFEARSQNNRLRANSMPGERGIIYDRNKKELAWNVPGFRLVIDKDDLDVLDRGTLLNFTPLESPAPLDRKSEVRAPSFLTGFTKGYPEKNISFEEDLGYKLDFAKNSKTDFNLAVAYSWEAAEEFRKIHPEISIRIEPFSLRRYSQSPGFAQAVGYLGFGDIGADNNEKKGGYGQKLVGKDGVEKSYDSLLRGKDGTKLVEIDSKNRIVSESIQENPSPGKDIILTIDSRLSSVLYNIIQQVVEEKGFQGGSAVVMDVLTGDVLAIVSYPEYELSVFTNSSSREEIQSLINNPKKPFFNRATRGLYPPGSVIKPLVALAALNEKIIDPQEEIFANGSISIPNPYDPAKKSVFYDWKVHGMVDMRHALAVSSDVYFYTIGGGFGKIAGLGVKKINEYGSLFGFGERTGVDLSGEESGMIPSPELKKILNPGDPIWRVGDTYNISIGQGDWQVTPLQMAAFTAAIANDGTKVKPHLLESFLDPETGEVSSYKHKESEDNISVPKEFFRIVKAGMRLAALEGTAKALGDLTVPLAGKTGTAEVGSGKKYTNSWFIGFLPYEKPRVAVSVVLEHGRAENLVGAVFVTRQLLEWMIYNTPGYFIPLENAADSR